MTLYTSLNRGIPFLTCVTVMPNTEKAPWFIVNIPSRTQGEVQLPQSRNGEEGTLRSDQGTGRIAQRQTACSSTTHKSHRMDGLPLLQRECVSHHGSGFVIMQAVLLMLSPSTPAWLLLPCDTLHHVLMQNKVLYFWTSQPPELQKINFSQITQAVASIIPAENRLRCTELQERSQECGSMVQCLPSMCKALGTMPSTEKKRRK